MRLKYAPIFVLMLALSGCGRSPSLVPNNPPPNGKGIVKLTIQWDSFGGQKKSAAKSASTIMSATEPNITHVGARLEYPAENAVFTQSVSRNTAEEVGIITMEVPPSTKANLYVVAVEKGGSTYGENLVHWFGVINDLEITAGTVLDIKMNEVLWIPATWEVDNAYRAAYESGLLTAPATAERTTFTIRVCDPFRTDASLALIGINGHSSGRRSMNGWRYYDIVCLNPTPGIPNTSRCQVRFGYPPFYPYLKYEPFNLPSAQYALPPLVMDLQVRWE